jgi:hypothetical protein
LGNQSSVSELVVARMKELADSRTPWHRGLWQPGTVVLLDEVVEVVLGTWNGSITSDEAMKDVIRAALAQASRDPGVGDRSVRDALNSLLNALLPSGNSRTKPTPELQQLLERTIAFTERIRTGYFLRWVQHVQSDAVTDEEVELTARLLVAHLFDEGFHRNHVHGWLMASGNGADLTDLLKVGRDMLLKPPRDYEFIVGLTRAPLEVRESFGDRWMDSDSYIDQFRSATNPERRPIPREGAGAVRWKAEARDPHGAMYKLLEWQEKLLARVQLGFGQAEKVEFEADVVDKSTNKIRTPLQDLRSIRLPSIQRNRLFIGGDNSEQQLDGAIALLASQSGEVRGASIASVWAAAEGIFGRPGGKGTDVADRLADIVTCSYPRAEIGELARSWVENNSDDLADSLRDQVSADQAEIMSKHLMTNGDPGFKSASDRAAVVRYIQLASQPEAVLQRVRSYYSGVFRRLYYQRNFIMHAAKFDSVTLGVSARTAPALVAAALDRVVNAQHGRISISPLALAARAENELEMVGKSGTHAIYLLLD